MASSQNRLLSQLSWSSQKKKQVTWTSNLPPATKCVDFREPPQSILWKPRKSSDLFHILEKNSPDPFHLIFPQFRKHDLQRLDLLTNSPYVRFNWFPVSKFHIHPTLSQRHPEAMEAIHHYFSSAKLVRLPGPGRAWGCECWKHKQGQNVVKKRCFVALLLKHYLLLRCNATFSWSAKIWNSFHKEPWG